LILNLKDNKMPTEIERKFLVNSVLWAKINPSKSVRIQQAYLSTDPEKTIRVRTLDTKAYLTIKGKTTGISRAEFEYEIPIEDAHELIDGFCSSVIKKIRHYLNYQEKLWEIDVFEGLNEGLIVAEIELESEHESFEKPSFIGEEVSNDFRYQNANLSQKPYTTW
jgi:CYTH domain-containing protein